MVDDGSDPIYETIHFSVISNSFENNSSSTNQSADNFVEPTALVAQVSYRGNESESNNCIVDNGSTHHMNGYHTEFFDMRSDGYVDGVHVKGLTSNTKAYGIGSCIVCFKDLVCFIKNVLRMYFMYRIYFINIQGYSVSSQFVHIMSFCVTFRQAHMSFIFGQ